MRSFVLLSIVIFTFVLPLRMSGRRTGTVVTAFGWVVVWYLFALRVLIQNL